MRVPFQITRDIEALYGILAVATNSIGMLLTTTGSTDVVFLVLKFMRSSLHFVSFSRNFSEEARVD